MTHISEFLTSLGDPSPPFHFAQDDTQRIGASLVMEILQLRFGMTRISKFLTCHEDSSATLQDDTLVVSASFKLPYKSKFAEIS